MRASHLTLLMTSLFLLSGCGSRSPYDDNDPSCALESGGMGLGLGGNYQRGGTTAKGGTFTYGGSTYYGGTTSYGARGGYGGYSGTSFGGRGGTGGYGATGGINYAGGKVGYGGSGGSNAGGFAGTPRGGNAGVAGRGGAAGIAGRGGSAGYTGFIQGGFAATGWIGGTTNQGGNAGYGAAAGTFGLGAAGSATGGTVNAGGATTGGVANAGTANVGVAGATAGSSPGGAGPWTGCVCDQTRCGTCPTTTVTVDRGSYYIDATETTNAEYSQFLAANVSLTAQPAVCSWNLTFIPNVNWPLIGKDNMPVTWVDWCDAYAYCAWAKKRLCGAIGGGTASFEDSDNPGTNQWFAACTNGGTSIYPYGALYDATACNGADYGMEALVAAGSMASCQVTGAGIYDMSGNAYEWEDSCGNWTGGSDTCHTRGGSYFTSDPNILRCRTASTLYTRNSVRSSIGFRCCADK